MITISDSFSSSSADPVLIFRQGILGRIRLNRPKALNSLTLEMVRLIAGALDRFQSDPTVRCVLLDGEGTRGLCAGGDIRAIHESGRRGDGGAELFWREEYIVNARIAAFPKPYIAIMDGITMGGGVGVAAHGSHRIVTERSKVAMPEVGIGFVPDVGGTWLLSRAPGELGTYLALTGEMIGGDDAIDVGLADLIVSSQRIPAMIDALASLGKGARPDEIRGVLQWHSRPADRGKIWQHRSVINSCFAYDCVEQIVVALNNTPGEFSEAALRSLLEKSPTSLKVALRLLRLARSSSLHVCLQREYRAAVRCLRGHDFYEGVRAAVIDKDRKPRWQPNNLKAVSGTDVDSYLAVAHAEEPTLSAGSEG